MKKVFHTMALLSLSITLLSAQDDYKMFLTMLLEPKLDQISAFEENLATHNKKFHNEGFMSADVWSIFSGSNAGKYAWVMGPLTFSDFDSRERDQAHDDDWNNNVLALCKHVTDFEWVKLREDLSYTPEGSESGKELYSVYDVKKGQWYRFEKVLKMAMEVYKAKDYPDYFRVYYSRFQSNTHRDVAISNGLRTWASLDEKSTFRKDFEEVHGEGSSDNFLKEYRESYNSYEDELSVYLPHLSGTAK